MKDKLMLIVDAMDANSQPFAQYFEADYSILHACSGVQATALIQEYACRLSIILLDISMPNMDGMDVLKWMANKPYQEIPVVAVADDSRYELEALENGAWDFMTRPIHPAVIHARLNNILRRNDDTDQPQMAAQLQKAKMEINNLVNSIPGGIAVYKLTNHFESLYFSDGVAALSGHTRQEYAELMKQPAEQIVYEVDRKRLYDAANQKLRKGHNVDLTYRIHHKNGNLIWVQLNAVVISIRENTRIVHAVLQSVSKQNQLYDILVNQTQNAIYVSDTSTYELLYFNKMAANVLDIPENSYGGKKCYEYMFGRTSPCPFCKISQMRNDQFLERDFYHLDLQRTYHLKGKLVDWCGIHAHVEYFTDVTEHNANQAKLKETQNLLAAALYNTKVTVWEYDIASQTIIQSFNFMQVHGMPDTIANVPESLIESGFVHPQSAADFRSLYQEVKSEKGNLQRDILLQNASRSGYRWFRIRYIPVLESDGRHLRSIGTSIDITEQRNLEESFQEIESLRSEITNGIMVNVSKNTVETIYSQMQSVKELNDGNMTTFFQKASARIPDKAQRAQFNTVFQRENLLHSYAMGRTEQFMEALCQYKNAYKHDEFRIVQLHIRLTKSPYTGDVIGYTYVVDVNEQRTAEAIMDKVALDNFEFILLLNLPENTAKMISNPSTRNKTAPKDYPDYERSAQAFCEEFLGQSQQAFYKKQMARETIIKHLKKANQYVLTLQVHRQHQDARMMRLSYSYLNKTAGNVLVTVEDITDLMRTEQEKRQKLAQALEAAKQASASKSEFLSNMSHDMRTPMNAIIGFSQMALEEETCDTSMKSYMKKVNEAGHYLLDLINNVLDMSKIENKKMELNLEAVNSQELFGGIVSSVMPMMNAKHISFKFEIHNFIDGKAAIMDKLHVQQIFVNLLSNAAKFTPEHGTVECSIEMLHFDGRYAQDRAIIRDNGCGMSPEFLEKVFLPFEQESSMEAQTQSGTGLGLTIVKSLVDLMGGTITLNSKKGVGTEVILHFTTELVEMDPLKNAKPLELPDTVSFEGKRILLCEDHPLNQEIACKLLAKKGFLIDIAANGADGLNRYTQSAVKYYDAILMDIRMPVLDGLQVTAAIRRLNRPDAKTVPIIAMTANAFADDIQKSFEAGMNAHLSKPIEPSKLYEVLYTVLSGGKGV